MTGGGRVPTQIQHHRFFGDIPWLQLKPSFRIIKKKSLHPPRAPAAVTIYWNYKGLQVQFLYPSHQWMSPSENSWSRRPQPRPDSQGSQRCPSVWIGATRWINLVPNVMLYLWWFYFDYVCTCSLRPINVYNLLGLCTFLIWVIRNRLCSDKWLC